MTTQSYERVRIIASDVFGVSLEEISDESSPESIERWDSTQHLTFVLALEEAFQLQLTPEETESIRNIGEAAKLVQKKLQVARG
ncbi:MAG TPA: acyl carrier protein [Candidatus Sulfotelmatobacter sp.]|nr:acyl carrier protein [Candidatus Sulfotelmatobacter sp.]